MIRDTWTESSQPEGLNVIRIIGALSLSLSLAAPRALFLFMPKPKRMTQITFVEDIIRSLKDVICDLSFVQRVITIKCDMYLPTDRCVCYHTHTAISKG